MSSPSNHRSNMNVQPHSDNIWAPITLAIFSLVLSLLPGFMPDQYKTKMQASLGENYGSYWAVSFAIAAVIFIYLTFRQLKAAKNRRLSDPSTFDHLSSKKSTKINSSKEGDFKANDIKSGENTELNLEHNGSVDVQNIHSEGNTEITNKGL